MHCWIKICGLTTSTAVQSAATAGADAIGFVFAESARRISPADARQLSEALPGTIAVVAVFLHPAQWLLDEVIETLQPDIVQTDVSDLGYLKLPDHQKLLPVIRDHGAGGFDAIGGHSMVLFEGARSGQGEAADWSRAARLATETQLVLAGGLNAVNVTAAIEKVRPFGVDVSSGVEHEPGKKDPEKIAAFVQAVRAAET